MIGYKRKNDEMMCSSSDKMNVKAKDKCEGFSPPKGFLNIMYILNYN